MQTPPRIAWHGLTPSDQLRELVDDRIAELARTFPRLVSVAVTVELPHQRHVHGNHVEVKIHATLPGHEVVIDREPGDDARHTDPGPAIRDAFDAVTRRLRATADKYPRGDRPPRI